MKHITPDEVNVGVDAKEALPFRKEGLSHTLISKTTITFNVLEEGSVHSIGERTYSQYHENCKMVGYFPEGDSFLFTQGEYDEKKSVILCLSRRFLEATLADYPRNPKHS